MSVSRIKIICKSSLTWTIENVDDTSVTWNNDGTLYEMGGLSNNLRSNQA
jgi:hypothetical protein